MMNNPYFNLLVTGLQVGYRFNGQPVTDLTVCNINCLNGTGYRVTGLLYISIKYVYNILMHTHTHAHARRIRVYKNTYIGNKPVTC